MRILLVDDEAQLAQHIATALLQAGHESEIATDGEVALDRARSGNFDLVILDVKLPLRDGWSILSELRASHNPTRVLMLSARSEVEDRVKGLELGADDYLAKPFALNELIARVAALGRRFPSEAQPMLETGDLRLDLDRREAIRAGARIELSSREFSLLRLLMREPGRAFTRDELCAHVWEREHEYDTKLVEVFIGRLRRKLGEPSVIQTVRHVGYRIGPS
jgi:DNA-binding response OmpR family regulator